MMLLAAVALGAGYALPHLGPGETAYEARPAKAEPNAKGKSSYQAPALPEAPNPQGMLARLAWGTVIVLGLSVASIFALRRWLAVHAPAGAGPQVMRLVESLPLGNRCSVHLVHLRKREILIGVDAAGIKTIVPVPAAFDDALTEASGAAPEALPAAAEAN
jgi:flagellar biogenesis protein FliO